MRDLAQQKFSGPYGVKKNNTVVLRLIIVLAVVLGIGFFVKSKFLNTGSVSGSADVVLREAPRGLTPVDIKDEGAGKGVDLKLENASFDLVKSGFNGKVTATRSYTNGIYSLNVDATLENPQGHQYGVWAVNGDDVVLVDYMGGNKTNFSLRVRKDDDKLMKYDGIWITFERSKEDRPEEHIFEGTF